MDDFIQEAIKRAEGKEESRDHHDKVRTEGFSESPREEVDSSKNISTDISRETTVDVSIANQIAEAVNSDVESNGEIVSNETDEKVCFDNSDDENVSFDESDRQDNFHESDKQDYHNESDEEVISDEPNHVSYSELDDEIGQDESDDEGISFSEAEHYPELVKEYDESAEEKDDVTLLDTYPDKEDTNNASVEEKESIAQVTTPSSVRQGNSIMDELDAELEELLSKQVARIKVVGVGGGGNNTLNRISEVGIKGTDTIAVNTDAQDLLYTHADKKILIGKEVTGGLGAGAQPKIGEEAAKENEIDLKKALGKCDLVFVTCGLGGGTGTGAAPVVSEIAKKSGALVVAVVTLPFAMEGQRRYENAIVGLEKLENTVDTLIVIPNDKLLELAPELPLQTAFKVADEILTNSVKGIAELITKAGLVNLDFADVRTVMGKGGIALIGMGESDSENRAVDAVEKAIANPLLDVDISGATGALINICGGPDMTLEESRKIVETISERLDPEAKIIWGAQISEDLDSTIRALLVVTGVRSAQIFGTDRDNNKAKHEMESELGIDFID